MGAEGANATCIRPCVIHHLTCFCIAVIILSKSQSYVNREESDPEELTGESRVVVRSEALIVY